jgi:hypothetical protein
MNVGTVGSMLTKTRDIVAADRIIF